MKHNASESWSLRSTAITAWKHNKSLAQIFCQAGIRPPLIFLMGMQDALVTLRVSVEIRSYEAVSKNS